MQTQLNGFQVQITGLQTQIAGYQTQIATLQAQVKSLTAIVDLSQSTVLLSQQFVGVQSIGDQVADNFNATYSGYVAVSMSQISDISNVQVGVLIFFASSVNSGQYTSEPIGPYSFTSIPGLIVFPVTPGSVTVYLSNTDSTPENATLSITYYY